MFQQILRLAEAVRPSNTMGSVVWKRWAGHSKWQNIRHTKALMDTARSKLFQKYSKMIILAVNEGGGPNPELNSKLMSILEQAKKANMPASSINNSIKAAAGNKSAEQLTMLTVRGPARCVLLVEILAVNIVRTKQSLATLFRKHLCKYDESAMLEFTRKGILISDLQISFDKALEDAISTGVEEVIELEGGNKVQFECSPELTFKSKTRLEKLGYTIDSAVVEYIPNKLVEINDSDLELYSDLLRKLDETPEVVRVIDNIA